MPTHPYLLSVEALQQLFSSTGIDYWADWMQIDIEEWESNRNVEHHFRAYGGMGTLNDLIINSSHNGHNILPQSEPFANMLMDCLSAVSSAAAKQADYAGQVEGIDHIQLIRHLKSQLIRRPSFAIAYLDDPDMEAETQSIFAGHDTIQGRQCLKCATKEIDEHDLNCYLASKLIPKALMEVENESDMSQLLQDVLSGSFTNNYSLRKEIEEAISASPIVLIHETGNTKWECSSCSCPKLKIVRWYFEDRKLIAEVNRNKAAKFS